jgi:hypothetical protein
LIAISIKRNIGGLENRGSVGFQLEDRTLLCRGEYDSISGVVTGDARERLSDDCIYAAFRDSISSRLRIKRCFVPRKGCLLEDMVKLATSIDMPIVLIENESMGILGRVYPTEWAGQNQHAVVIEISVFAHALHATSAYLVPSVLLRDHCYWAESLWTLDPRMPITGKTSTEMVVYKAPKTSTEMVVYKAPKPQPPKIQLKRKVIQRSPSVKAGFKGGFKEALAREYAAMIMAPGHANLVPVPDGSRAKVKIVRQKTVADMTYNADILGNQHSALLVTPLMRDHVFTLGSPPAGTTFTLATMTPDSAGELVDAALLTRSSGAGVGLQASVCALTNSVQEQTIQLHTGVAYTPQSNGGAQGAGYICQPSELLSGVDASPLGYQAFPVSPGDVVNVNINAICNPSLAVLLQITKYTSTGGVSISTMTATADAAGRISGRVGVTMPSGTVGLSPLMSIITPASTCDINLLRVELTVSGTVAGATLTGLPVGYLTGQPIHDYGAIASSSSEARCTALSVHVRDYSASLYKDGVFAAAVIDEHAGPGDLDVSGAIASAADYSGLADYPDSYNGTLSGPDEGLYGVVPLTDVDSRRFRAPQLPLYFDNTYLYYHGVQIPPVTGVISLPATNFKARIIVDSVWEIDTSLQFVDSHTGFKSSAALEEVDNALFNAEFLGDNPSHFQRIASFLAGLGRGLGNAAARAAAMAPMLALIPGLGPELATAARAAGAAAAIYR